MSGDLMSHALDCIISASVRLLHKAPYYALRLRRDLSKFFLSGKSKGRSSGLSRTLCIGGRSIGLPIGLINSPSSSHLPCLHLHIYQLLESFFVFGTMVILWGQWHFLTFMTDLQKQKHFLFSRSCVKKRSCRCK